MIPVLSLLLFCSFPLFACEKIASAESQSLRALRQCEENIAGCEVALLSISPQSAARMRPILLQWMVCWVGCRKAAQNEKLELITSQDYEKYCSYLQELTQSPTASLKESARKALSDLHDLWAAQESRILTLFQELSKYISTAETEADDSNQLLNDVLRWVACLSFLRPVHVPDLTQISHKRLTQLQSIIDSGWATEDQKRSARVGKQVLAGS